MKVEMSTIGHNHAPLADRIFSDPSISVEDVLEAVSTHLERQHSENLADISSTATQLADNKKHLPEAFSDHDVMTALDLLARISSHDDSVAEQKEQLLTAAKAFLSNLETLCKPLDSGISDLKKNLRARLTDAFMKRLDEHNADRSDAEPKLKALTLRGSSGAKATLTDGEDVEIESPNDVPRKFCAPDPKLIAAAIKAGEKVPGTSKKRKPSLRVST